MAKYECMVIVNPRLSEEERNTNLAELQAILEKGQAKVEKQDVWGEKKMAYQLNKSDTGFYILYHLELPGENITTISKEINLNRNIWRYMFVKEEA